MNIRRVSCITQKFGLFSGKCISCKSHYCICAVTIAKDDMSRARSSPRGGSPGKSKTTQAIPESPPSHVVEMTEEEEVICEEHVTPTKKPSDITAETVNAMVGPQMVISMRRLRFILGKFGVNDEELIESVANATRASERFSGPRLIGLLTSAAKGGPGLAGKLTKPVSLTLARAEPRLAWMRQSVRKMRDEEDQESDSYDDDEEPTEEPITPSRRRKTPKQEYTPNGTKYLPAFYDNIEFVTTPRKGTPHK